MFGFPWLIHFYVFCCFVLPGVQVVSVFSVFTFFQGSGFPKHGNCKNVILPKLKVYNTKVHQIEGYEEIRKNAKLHNKKQEFINGANKVLNLFDIDAKKYDYKLVLAIMQSAEDFFGKRKLGETKKEVVIECVKRFFNEDILLCEKIIDMVFPNFRFVLLSRIRS